MKCNKFREKVADLFDKTIDMQTQAELDEHMKSCPECKAYYDELRETFDMLQPISSEKIKDEKEKKTVADSSSQSAGETIFILRSSLVKFAAIFIAAAFLCGLSFAAYHAISSKKTAEEIADSVAIAKEKLIRISKDGDVFIVNWPRGTWVVDANGNSYKEEHLVRHSPFLRLNEVKIKIDGIEHDIHELLDKPASIVKKAELDIHTKTINLITTPVQIPANVKGNVNPELTILLTGTPPKDSGTKTTIWVRRGIYDGFSWKNYSFTSWKWNVDDISHYLEEVACRKDHHVRINVCKGTPQKHIDRIKSIMQECGVTNYEIVKQ